MKQFTKIYDIEVKVLRGGKYKDTRITSDHLYLIGKIRSLSHTFPCVATNEYLACELNTDIRTIVRWIKALKDMGFIRIEIIKRKRTIFIEEENILIAIREINPEALKEEVVTDPVEEAITKEDLTEELDMILSEGIITRIKNEKNRLHITDNSDLNKYVRKALKDANKTYRDITEDNAEKVLAVLEEADYISEKDMKIEKVRSLPAETIDRIKRAKEGLGIKNNEDLDDYVGEALDGDYSKKWYDITQENADKVLGYIENIITNRKKKAL